MDKTIQLFEPLSPSAARDITDQISAGLEAMWHLIAKAYQGRAWLALGYESWDDYCTREFGTARLRLPREDRQEVVASLRESGMSTRAIAAATGQSEGNVRNDLKAGAQNCAPGPVTGTDGKQYQPTQPDPDDKGEPLFMPGELDAIDDTLADEYGTDVSDETHHQTVAENVESKHLPEWQPTKPDLGNGISHPARYSPELLRDFRDLLWTFLVNGQGLNDEIRVLDPFAGTGRIHELMHDDDEGNPSPFDTVGIEIEKEWADLNPRTHQGSALALPFDPGTFDAIVTSPTYGNRLADSHNASDPERRRSYTHDLGHELHVDNSGALHWRNGHTGSEAYRAFHEKAWDEAVLVLRPGGLFILNCCDHIRDGVVQPVTAWHCGELRALGLDYLTSSSVPTRKLRQGANSNLREQEQVHVFRKPDV